MEKYTAGTKIVYSHESYGQKEIIRGVVIENCKLPGDICVQWETGQFSSYDLEWLNQNVEILK